MTLMRCDPESENIIHVQQYHFNLIKLAVWKLTIENKPIKSKNIP